jgi:hypothetical protein
MRLQLLLALPITVISGNFATIYASKVCTFVGSDLVMCI